MPFCTDIETHSQPIPELTTDESHELINVVPNYIYVLGTLDRYDYQQLKVEQTTQEERFHATYDNAMAAIQQLKEKFGESRWFGNEKDDFFKSSIEQMCNYNKNTLI